jgi:hypothetical protein
MKEMPRGITENELVNSLINACFELEIEGGEINKNKVETLKDETITRILRMYI